MLLNTLSTVWNNNSGQDLIEYALLGGFVTVAAGALVPSAVLGPFTTIYQALSLQLSRVVAMI